MRKLLIGLTILAAMTFTACEEMDIEPEKNENCCGNPPGDPDPDPNGDD